MIVTSYTYTYYLLDVRHEFGANVSLLHREKQLVPTFLSVELLQFYVTDMMRL